MIIDKVYLQTNERGGMEVTGYKLQVSSNLFALSCVLILEPYILCLDT